MKNIKEVYLLLLKLFEYVFCILMVMFVPIFLIISTAIIISKGTIKDIIKRINGDKNE